MERCSSCGRTAAAAKKLFPARVAGIQLVICDVCVEECAELIADVPTRIPGGVQACGFCAKPEDEVAVLVGIGETTICDVCVDAYRAELG
jgi:ATP-dependent protease Clp ATPase subunit